LLIFFKKYSFRDRSDRCSRSKLMGEFTGGVPLGVLLVEGFVFSPFLSLSLWRGLWIFCRQFDRLSLDIPRL
jgi:hypothetical protein